MRGFHNMTTDNAVAEEVDFGCPRGSCDKVGSNGFETKKQLQVHLKKDHPSEFQCPQPGCDRVGIKGWMRQREMVKHIAKVHATVDDAGAGAEGQDI